MLWGRWTLAPLGSRLFWPGLAKGFLLIRQKLFPKAQPGQEQEEEKGRDPFTKYFLNSHDAPRIEHMAPSGAGVKSLDGEAGQTALQQTKG